VLVGNFSVSGTGTFGTVAGGTGVFGTLTGGTGSFGMLAAGTGSVGALAVTASLTTTAPTYASAAATYTLVAGPALAGQNSQFITFPSPTTANWPGSVYAGGALVLPFTGIYSYTFLLNNGNVVSANSLTLNNGVAVSTANQQQNMLYFRPSVDSAAVSGTVITPLLAAGTLVSLVYYNSAAGTSPTPSASSLTVVLLQRTA
jgi:hypothetical protein